MTVRRFLAVAALAVLIGAQTSAASAAGLDFYAGSPRSPASVRAATTAVTIANVRREAKHASHRHAKAAKRETGIFAAENTPLNLPSTAKKRTSGSTIGGGSILRTIGGLLVVVGAIYGVAWVLRRVKRSREDQASGRGLRAIATLPLGSGRSLHLVRAGTDVILVGSSEHGVVPIQRYTEQEALANGVLSDSGQDSALHDAATMFMPDGDPIAPGSGSDGSGQWRTLAARPAGSGASVVDALRRLTVRS